MNKIKKGVIKQGLTAIFLLLGVLVTPPTSAAIIDRSDLNKDFIVDTLDLEIFSDRYLSQDWQTVDWCHFYETSINNKKYFRNYTSDKIERYQQLLAFITTAYECQIIVRNGDKSDLNKDHLVDIADLNLFATNYLETHWKTVDWCLFREATISGERFDGRRTKYYLKHFWQLLLFINNDFACGGTENDNDSPPVDYLQLESTPKSLARIAKSVEIDGDYFITDPVLGSLFIYDADLIVKAEIKDLNRPLGVAIDSNGYILVGNDGRDNIEVYDPSNGELITEFGVGQLRMPTAISLDSQGNIYVTDSVSKSVWVYDQFYNPLRVIGKSSSEGVLDFPVDTEIIGRLGLGDTYIEEVFVADQGNKWIQVYSLEGRWLRTMTFEGSKGQDCRFDWWSWGYVCAIPGAPEFKRLQALEVDELGRLHVLDNFNASVTVLEPATGGYLAFYGEYGTEAGFLRVPMDILVTNGRAEITVGDGDRIEVLPVPQ